MSKQCDSEYEVWRCIMDEKHKSVHESYAISGATMYWTHDKTIALCVQPKNPRPALRDADLA